MLQTTEQKPPTTLETTEQVPTTDAAPADVITSPTSPEAAARKCPNEECEALMVVETIGLEKRPTLVCHECGHEEPIGSVDETSKADGETNAAEGEPSAPAPETPAKPATVTRSMACQTCGLQILVELRGGEGNGPIRGFSVVAIEKVGDAGDVSMETTFGRSANGFPQCPKDGVAMLSLGPVPVGEAFRGVKDALQDTAQPVQPRLPGTTPPFNVEAAFKAIVIKNSEVAEARAIYEDRKKEAADAKKDLESEEALLGKLISEFDRRRRDQEAAERGTLRPEQESVCFTERMTGQPCHICRDARRKAKEDESADDGDLRITSLQEHLARRGVHLIALDLQGLGEEGAEVEQLEAFAHDQAAKLPTFLLERSCIAGPAGEEGQRCTTCGVLLHNKTDEDETDANPYPEGDRVGLDCAGDPNAPAADADAPEPARQPQRRHKTPKDAAAAKSKAAREAKAEKKPAEAKRKKRTRSR